MIKVKELLAYQQVRHILGDKEAERQLFIALNHKDSLPTGISEKAEDVTVLNLWDLFAWASTPQEHIFWQHIADKYCPDWQYV